MDQDLSPDREEVHQDVENAVEQCIRNNSKENIPEITALQHSQMDSHPQPSQINSNPQPSQMDSDPQNFQADSKSQPSQIDCNPNLGGTINPDPEVHLHPDPIVPHDPYSGIDIDQELDVKIGHELDVDIKHQLSVNIGNQLDVNLEPYSDVNIGPVKEIDPQPAVNSDPDNTEQQPAVNCETPLLQDSNDSEQSQGNDKPDLKVTTNQQDPPTNSHSQGSRDTEGGESTRPQVGRPSGVWARLNSIPEGGQINSDPQGNSDAEGDTSTPKPPAVRPGGSVGTS